MLANPSRSQIQGRPNGTFLGCWQLAIKMNLMDSIMIITEDRIHQFDEPRICLLQRSHCRNVRTNLSTIQCRQVVNLIREWFQVWKYLWGVILGFMSHLFLRLSCVLQEQVDHIINGLNNVHNSVQGVNRLERDFTLRGVSISEHQPWRWKWTEIANCMLGWQERKLLTWQVMVLIFRGASALDHHVNTACSFIF